MAALNENEFNKAVASSYKKKYEEAISLWFSKDELGNIELKLPEDVDENTPPAEVLQAIKEIVAHESFFYSVNDVINYTRVSLDIIREYAEYVNWEVVSIKQVLDEEFIEEFINELDMQKVLLHQDLSDDFVKRHIKKSKIKVKSKEKSTLDAKYMQDFMDMIANSRGHRFGGGNIFRGDDNNVFTTYTNSLVSSATVTDFGENEEVNQSDDVVTTVSAMQEYISLSEANKSSSFREKFFNKIK